MSSSCIEKLPHTCGSRRGLQVFMKEDGTYDGWCFSCNTYVSDPYKDKPPNYKPTVVKKSPEEIRAEIKAISGYKVLALPERKLSLEALNAYNIRIGVSEEDGVTPVTHYYPYTKDGELVGYKIRVIENKAMFRLGESKSLDLFGWETALASGSKRLYITEGELDAVALYQILGKFKTEKYKEYQDAVVSVPNGAGSADKDINAVIDKIRRHFSEVVLVFDQDAPGHEAVQKVIKLFPDFSVASLPAKDANECIIKGVEKACFNSVVFKAQRPKNTRLVQGSSLHEKAKEAPSYGLSWPWKHITKATRGIRFGETIYIGAGQKAGKSEIVNTLAAHFIHEHGLKVFLVKPEESNVKTYKMVASKMVGRFFHDPDKPFDEKAYDQAGEMIGSSLYMLDLYQHVDWNTLKGDIRSAALDGCRAIIIDPITNLTNGLSAADANTKLQEIAQELSAMALDLNVVIFIFCHLRNPDSGLPHERGGEVLSSQFAGSRAMARSCNLMLGLEGNRDPSLPQEQRNLRTLVLLEDREHGEAGRFQLYWDANTGLFNEVN